MAVTETWFKQNSVANVDGFCLYRKTDQTDEEAAVCVYINDSFDSYELNDAGLNICKLEQVWAVIYFGVDKY